ncbi:MBL fold metallo-hydrolase [Alkalimonas amylolytica]|uniref:Glyoxylase, beta-lactamase superfamily II n=1 Tax=Alkalimonas amylolytica TaxID=152573 RepID=A0A1H4BF05_ALKAM|nr:MBL fold metallo-hydrolase [Alkalimonas amylolytica]SEA46741.1 Glyoxylase, beta-lactamase superfamily II [Alkalimonas amylolytica]
MTTQQQPMHIEMFFDNDSSTFSYLLVDKSSNMAALIDPVLDYDAAAGMVDTRSADQILAYLNQHELKLQWILETHAHADHLSAAHYLRQKTGARVGIGEGIRKVQQTFKVVFNIGDEELTAKGECFDHLFHDGETFQIGALTGRVINTPGHTNDSVSYLIAGHLFVGDSLFMPDAGTARCDFPGGDAAVLYQSIQRLYQLPDDTPMYMCHDYQPNGRELRYKTTVGEQKQQNIHVAAKTEQQDFVQKRMARDATLAVPRLIYPSVQVNIRAGKLPTAESNGTAYIKIPLKGAL